MMSGELFWLVIGTAIGVAFAKLGDFFVDYWKRIGVARRMRADLIAFGDKLQQAVATKAWTTQTVQILGQRLLEFHRSNEIDLVFRSTQDRANSLDYFSEVRVFLDRQAGFSIPGLPTMVEGPPKRIPLELSEFQGLSPADRIRKARQYFDEARAAYSRGDSDTHLLVSDFAFLLLQEGKQHHGGAAHAAFFKGVYEDLKEIQNDYPAQAYQGLIVRTDVMLTLVSKRPRLFGK